MIKHDKIKLKIVKKLGQKIWKYANYIKDWWLKDVSSILQISLQQTL